MNTTEEVEMYLKSKDIYNLDDLIKNLNIVLDDLNVIERFEEIEYIH